MTPDIMGPSSEDTDINEQEDDLNQRMQEALEAFQANYPWMREGAKFKFRKLAPQPMEGVYKKEVYSHDFADDTFVAKGYFYKSKDGQRIEMGAETQIRITDDSGNEATPKISFDFTIDDFDRLGIEEVK